MVIMKIKIETIPSRITTYFQREVCSEGKQTRMTTIKGNEIRK